MADGAVWVECRLKLASGVEPGETRDELEGYAEAKVKLQALDEWEVRVVREVTDE